MLAYLLSHLAFCLAAASSADLYKMVVHEYEMDCYGYTTPHTFWLYLEQRTRPVVLGHEHLVVAADSDSTHAARFRLDHKSLDALLTRANTTAIVDVTAEKCGFGRNLYLPRFNRELGRNWSSRTWADVQLGAGGSRPRPDYSCSVQYLNTRGCQEATGPNHDPYLVFNWLSDSTFVCDASVPQLPPHLEEPSASGHPALLVGWGNRRIWKSPALPRGCRAARLYLAFDSEMAFPP